MRVSTLATSLLVSTATAWRLPDFDWSNQGYRPIRTTIAPAAPTTVAPSAIPSVIPTSTAIASTPAAAAPTASAAATGSSSSSLTADQQAALDAHNAARADVGTSDLAWDAALAAAAQTYADTLAKSGSFEHSGVQDQGENLYMQSNADSPLANAVKSFLEEKSSYSGQAISASNYMGFGHYSEFDPFLG